MDRQKASRDGAELLRRERQRASFNVAEMTEYLHGKAAVETKDKLVRILAADPVFSKDDKVCLRIVRQDNLLTAV